MSESKTPQAGEWWEHTKLKRRCFIVGVDVRGHIAYQVNELESPLRIWTFQVDHFLSDNVYLPDCTGWDWQAPAKPDPGEGWRLLEPDEKVIQGDEYFEPKGTPRWEVSDNWRYRSGEQSPELVYRRRKEKPPEPVVAVCPYVVSLDTYEKVVAERNALQDRLREIEAKAKFYESPF